MPGIGAATTAKLLARKIDSVGTLMGLLMTMNLDKEKFVAELVEDAGVAKKCGGGRVSRRCARGRS